MVFSSSSTKKIGGYTAGAIVAAGLLGVQIASIGNSRKPSELSELNLKRRALSQIVSDAQELAQSKLGLSDLKAEKLVTTIGQVKGVDSREIPSIVGQLDKKGAQDILTADNLDKTSLDKIVKSSSLRNQVYQVFGTDNDVSGVSDETLQFLLQRKDTLGKGFFDLYFKNPELFSRDYFDSLEDAQGVYFFLGQRGLNPEQTIILLEENNVGQQAINIGYLPTDLETLLGIDKTTKKLFQDRVLDMLEKYPGRNTSEFNNKLLKQFVNQLTDHQLATLVTEGTDSSHLLDSIVSQNLGIKAFAALFT